MESKLFIFSFRVYLKTVYLIETSVLLNLAVLIGFLLYLTEMTIALECTKLKQILPDSDNCQKFYICDGGLKLHFICPMGKEFDVNTSECLNTGVAKCITSTKLRNVIPTPPGPILPTPPGATIPPGIELPTLPTAPGPTLPTLPTIAPPPTLPTPETPTTEV